MGGETFQSEDQDSQQSGSAATEDSGWWGRGSVTAWGRGGVWGSCLFVQGQLVRRRVWRMFHLVRQDGRKMELCTGTNVRKVFQWKVAVCCIVMGGTGMEQSHLVWSHHLPLN